MALLTQQASASPMSLAELAEKAKPSVVLLTVEDEYGTKTGTGTGFFVSGDGRIVTNHHVIDGAAKVTATLSNGDKRAVVGLLADDDERDIAILKADSTDAPYLALGDSKAVKPGDEIVVIGSPRGLANTLSAGIVSAIREHGLEDESLKKGEPGRSWGLQVTAAIAPGSSGSPIMTRTGEVVAVAVGMFVNSQGLNFGVPIEVTKSMLDKLAPGAAVRPFEGSKHNSVLVNLLISAAVFGIPAIVYAIWTRRKTPIRRAERMYSVPLD